MRGGEDAQTIPLYFVKRTMCNLSSSHRVYCAAKIKLPPSCPMCHRAGPKRGWKNMQRLGSFHYGKAHGSKLESQDHPVPLADGGIVIVTDGTTGRRKLYCMMDDPLNLPATGWKTRS